MHRGSYALALGLAICTAAFAETGTFSYFSPETESRVPQDRAAARQQEWIVSEIAGSLLNIAAFAGHFDAGDPFQVRNAGADSSGAPRFKLTRRVEEYTVTGDHPWSPEAYVRMARSLMADGAGLSVTEDLVEDRLDAAGPAAVSRLLHDHPRSGALHERAAYLLGLSVQKRATVPGFDPRPMLCRMTAHLAVARALHPGGVSKDGRIAEQMLNAVAANERVDAPLPAGSDHSQFWIIDPWN